MSIIEGLVLGLCLGPKLGINACCCGDDEVSIVDTLIADFNFSQPLTSWSSGSTNFLSSIASDQWLFDSNHSSGVWSNQTGSATMTEVGGGLRDRTCPSIWNGSSFGVGAWEPADGAHRIDCSDTSIGDIADSSTDLCFRLTFATTSKEGNDYLVTKWDTSVYPYWGWRLYNNTGGNIIFGMGDGTNFAGATLDSSIDVCDGAPHTVTVYVNPSAETFSAKIDGVEVVTGYDLSILDFSAVTNTRPIVINAITNSSNRGLPNGAHYIAFSVETGSSAAAMYAEDYWQHAGDPTSLVNNISRNCLVSLPLDASTVGHFAPDTLPIGYSSLFTSGLGLYVNDVRTNLLDYSEDFSQWTAGGSSTVTVNYADAPDNFRSATRVQAGANNANVNRTEAGFTELTDYVLSFWVKRGAGTDADWNVVFWNTNAGGLLPDTGSGTATSSWQRVEIPFSTAAGNNTVGSYIRVTNSGDEILIWGAQVELGTKAGIYIRTTGTAASIIAADYTASYASDWVTTTKGESETVWVSTLPQVDTANANLYQLQGSGSINRHLVRLRSNGQRVQFYVFDSTGSYFDDFGPVINTDYSAQENTLVLQWDSSAGLAAAENAALAMNYNDGEYTEAPSQGPYDASDTYPDVDIGHAAGAQQLVGFIQRIRFWAEERQAA